MSAEEVVELSLNAFKEDNVVFIPGSGNQKFVELFSNPELGKKVRENIRKSGRIPR